MFSLLAPADPEVGTEPAITIWDGVTVLDPRALVTQAGGIVYNPRNNAAIAEPMRKWLAEHAGVATEGRLGACGDPL